MVYLGLGIMVWWSMGKDMWQTVLTSIPVFGCEASVEKSRALSHEWSNPLVAGTSCKLIRTDP